MRLVSLRFRGFDADNLPDLVTATCEGEKIRFNAKWTRYDEPRGDWVLSFEAPVPTFGDSVDHPEHYNNHPSGVECIDIIEWMPSNVAFAVKHLWRCDQKHPNPMEDLRKAEWYVRREIRRRKRMMGEAP